MGCGRSTLGSDSPSRNSKEEEWNEGSGEPSSSSQKDPPAPPSASSTSTHQAIPFNHGGALLAQAKISGSQLDFFKVLDEKIENGPDYESEGEEESLIIRRSRLAMYLEQWNQITRRKPPAPAASSSSSSSTSAANQVFESQIGSLDSVPLIRAPTTTNSKSGSGKTLENESRSSSEDDESDEPKEAVKEQYMFMGSLYTLTRFRSDGSYIPRVDVSPAHKITEENDDLNRFEGLEVANTVLAKGSTKAEVIANDTGVVVSPQVVHYGKSNESVSMKVNGTFHKSDDAKVRKLERADTPYHHTLSGKDHIHPSRPASLVLRTVFPSQEEAS